MRVNAIFDRHDEVSGTTETFKLPANIRLSRIEGYNVTIDGDIRIEMMSGSLWVIESTPEAIRQLNDAIEQPRIGGHKIVIGQQ